MTKYGNQKPRLDYFQDGDIELAEQTIELMEEYGNTLLPWQKSVLRRWMATTEDGKWANDNCGLSVPRQNGKDLAESTEIPTPSGWRTMRDIKVGDYVFGDDGKPTKVIAKYEPDEREFFEIDFGNAGNFVNETIRAGAGHLWKINNTSDWGHKPRVVSTKWIYDNFDRLKRHRATISVDLCEAVEYSEQSLPIDPYLLGVWLGDGESASGQIVASEDDANFYQEKFLKVGKCHFRKDRRTGAVEIRCEAFFKLLNDNGLIRNKHIPSVYLHASKAQRLELLRGLMDTDGSAEHHSTAVSFSQSGRPELVAQIMELICSLGMKPSYRGKRLSKQNPKYKDVQELRFNVIGESVFNLPRKKAVFDKYNTKAQLFNHWYIKDIRKIEKTERYFCLGVDNRSHLFLCSRSYIPTHNTELAIARIIGGMIFLGERLVYTAQSVKTTDEIKRRVFRFFFDAKKEVRQLLTAEFDKEPKSFDYVELRNGGRCIFSTRTRTSMLGTTNDVVIIDECFPADTLVDGKRIQDFKVGDTVRTFDADGHLTTSTVTRTIKKPTPVEVAWLHGSFGCIISTRNHKHLTQRGWVRADEITTEDYLYVETQSSGGTMGKAQSALLELREADRIPKCKPEKLVEQEEAGLLLESMLEQRTLTRDEGRTQETQPDVERGVQGEDDCDFEGETLEATSTHGKWYWTNETPSYITQSSGRKLATRIRTRYTKGTSSDIWHADQLQARYCQPDTQSGDRGRWEYPLRQTQSRRCEENFGLELARVERAEIRKSSCLRELGLSDGGDNVYCIDVARTHNFIANGIVTHNCQEYKDSEEEAIRPTIASGPSGNSQVLMMGTPPTAGSAGTVFLRTRRNILNGKGGSWCWQEWSVENITANDDKKAWYATNPSMGYFLQERAVANEAVTMAQDSFNKMRLGWFVGIDAQRMFDDEEWNALAVDKVVLPEDPNLCYAVKFAPDRSAVTLAVGVWIEDHIHVEVVERKPMSAGIAWLTKWLLDRYRKCNKIVIDGAAGTQLLIEDLIRSDRRISKKILTPNVREAGAAYASFAQAIEEKTLTHFNQPILNSAIRTAKRRDIGRDGMFGFAPLNPSIQCDPIDAVAFAFYASTRFKRKAGSVTTQQIFI